MDQQIDPENAHILSTEGMIKRPAESHATGWDHYLSRLEIAAAGGDPGRDPWLGDST